MAGRTHGPLTRILATLIYLSDHRFGATTEELMEEMDVSKRTIWRYIKTLQSAGVRILNVNRRGVGVQARFRLVDRALWSRRFG